MALDGNPLTRDVEAATGREKRWCADRQAGLGERPIFTMGQLSFIGLTIVVDIPKATPGADDQSAQLARMERLCSALDDVREESKPPSRNHG